MRILDDYFEPERILTYIDALTFSKAEFESLKKLAKIERKKFSLEYQKFIIERQLPKETTCNEYITKRLLSKRLYSTDYNDKSTIRREIIYANALLPNDEEVEELLTKNGYTYEHLIEVMKVRKYILDIIKYKNNTIPDAILLQQIKTYKNYVTAIIALFKDKFQIDNATIILNRICEILATHKTYFEDKKHSK